MKKRLNKLIKKGVITETELNEFIKTLFKLSSLRVIPSKPKKVLKKLKNNKLTKNSIVDSDSSEIEIVENMDN